MANIETLPDESERYTADLADAEAVNWAVNRSWQRPLAFLLPRLDALRADNPVPGLIEFGCGAGLLANCLPEVVGYLGVDKCGHLLEKARRLCAGNPLRRFECLDARNVVATADVSCAWSFMKHFALREWDQVLAKVLSAGRFCAFDCQVAEDCFDDGVAFPHVFVSERRVLSAVAAAGYSIESEEVFGEFKVGGKPAKNVAYWCRRQATDSCSTLEAPSPAPEHYDNGLEVIRPDETEDLGRETPAFSQHLWVGGQEVQDLHPYLLKWVAGNWAPGEPVLLKDGAAVTDEWRLELNVAKSRRGDGK